MKDSWSLDQHNLQFFLETLFAEVLQWPIPVVVVIIAKVLATSMNFLPKCPFESHSHVVLCTFPWQNIHLQIHQIFSTSFFSTTAKLDFVWTQKDAKFWDFFYKKLEISKLVIKGKKWMFKKGWKSRYFCIVKVRTCKKNSKQCLAQ